MQLPLKDPNSVHKIGEDILTFLEIIYMYIHWDQEKSKMREINEILNAVNQCLTKSYNHFLLMEFTKFRLYLPIQVNILRAKIHRNANLIYFINCKVDLFKYPPSDCMYVSVQLLIIVEHLKCFIAVKLTGAKAK